MESHGTALPNRKIVLELNEILDDINKVIEEHNLSGPVGVTVEVKVELTEDQKTLIIEEEAQKKLLAIEPYRTLYCVGKPGGVGGC